MLCLSWQEEGANRCGVGHGDHAVNSRDTCPTRAPMDSGPSFPSIHVLGCFLHGC